MGNDTGLTQNSLPMFATSDAPALPGQSTLFGAVSPARILAQPGHARAYAMARALVFGTSTQGLLASYDPDSSLWKMSRQSPARIKRKMGVYDPQTHSWLLKACGHWVTWDRRGLYQLPTPAARISVIDGGAWPTPQARDTRSGKDPRNLARKNPNLNTKVWYWATVTGKDHLKGEKDTARYLKRGAL